MGYKWNVQRDDSVTEILKAAGIIKEFDDDDEKDKEENKDAKQK